MAEYQAAGGTAKHCNRRYGVSVVTAQETDLMLDMVRSVTRGPGGQYRVCYEEAEASAGTRAEAAQA
jgi:hypothetical protein